jgi:hypothetical protein
MTTFKVPDGSLVQMSAGVAKLTLPAGVAGATGPTGPTGAAASVATDAIWDAAGDLAVGSGADTAARLAKGADGTVLQMASAAVGWGSRDWATAAETWTYASADAPTFTFTISGDYTGVYHVGQRLRLTQTTVKFFIVTAISYGAGSTTVTIYGGTDYALADAAISATSYSGAKVPFGFPATPAKWTVSLTETTSQSQASATEGTVYSPGDFSIAIPVGVWNVAATWLAQMGGSTAGQGQLHTALSTANNSISDLALASYAVGYIYTNTAVIATVIAIRQSLTITSKTTYYPVIKSIQNVGTTTLAFNNGNATMTIAAVCAYL